MYVIYLNYKALTTFVPILHIEIKFMHFIKHSDSPRFSVLFQLVYHHEGAQSQLKPPQMPLLDSLQCNFHSSYTTSRPDQYSGILGRLLYFSNSPAKYNGKYIISFHNCQLSNLKKLSRTNIKCYRIRSL